MEKVNILESGHPTIAELVKSIQDEIDKQPFAKVGVMGLDGKMAYSYTVRVKNLGCQQHLED